MIISKTHFRFLSNFSGLSVFFLVFILGCQPTESEAYVAETSCDTVANVEGEYSCTGECIITGNEGQRTLLKISGETDKVEKYPGSDDGLYQVTITGSNDFRELEIGALSGLTLRTATAEVSDGQFPVIEEYDFETDSDCNAVGFIKTVRNPSPELFKTCVIICKKNS